MMLKMMVHPPMPMPTVPTMAAASPGAFIRDRME